jgi:hypothetical protein
MSSLEILLAPLYIYTGDFTKKIKVIYIEYKTHLELFNCKLALFLNYWKKNLFYNTES